MNIFKVARIAPSRVDRIAEVDTDDRPGSPRGYQSRVPPLAATSLKNHFVAEKFRCYGIYPVEELACVVVLAMLISILLLISLPSRSSSLETKGLDAP
jgi:hypothetical protein